MFVLSYTNNYTAIISPGEEISFGKKYLDYEAGNFFFISPFLFEDNFCYVFVEENETRCMFRV